MDAYTPNSLLDADRITQSNVAAFPADSLSPVKARQFVRDCLHKAGIDNSVIDNVELVASELATNAILHAATGPTVEVIVSGNNIRIEVRDASTATPLIADFGSEAATGRGLHVVSRVARNWGVDADQFGKTIWAEFDAKKPADLNEVQQPRITSELILSADTTEDSVTVRLNNVPVDLYFELEQHNDATLREFELLAIQMQDATPDAVLMHHQLAALLVRSTKYFNSPKSRLRVAVQRARHKGLECVNLKGTMDSERLSYAREFNSLMAEADLLCDQGVLLTSPASEAVRQLRFWITDEIQHQFLDGRPPIAFSL